MGSQKLCLIHISKVLNTSVGKKNVWKGIWLSWKAFTYV